MRFLLKIRDLKVFFFDNMIAMRGMLFDERAEFGVAGRAEIRPPLLVPPPLKMLILHQCIFASWDMRFLLKIRDLKVFFF